MIQGDVEPAAATRDEEHPDPGEGAARAPRLRLALVAVVSLGLGVGLAVALMAVRGPGPADATSAATDLPIGEQQDLPDLTGTVEPGKPAASPEAAVAAFLDAEEDGEYASSYALLSAADREQYRTSGGWVAAHADVMPPVTGYAVEGTTGGETRATVVTLIGFEPSLDQVVGLVPARARATWVVAAEDDGWVVALEESIFEPLHPPEEDAVDAVGDWAQSHVDCKPAGEHVVVLGVPALAQELCDEDAPVEVGDVEAFTEGFDTGSFLAAYGESVLEWGRVVPVATPVELRAVVAPIGPHWRVIGVLGPGPTR